MFFSLNKKFLYTIAAFFFLTAIIFLYSFYLVYGNKIQEEQLSAFNRNQQYMELLYENINLRKKIHQSSVSEQKNIERHEAELSRERKLAAESLRTYNSRYETIKRGIGIIFVSALLLLLSMLVLWYLIRRLVISPLNALAETSEKISHGNLSARIHFPHNKVFHDEIDILGLTFNKMAENIENSIKETQNREIFLQSLIDGIPDGISVIDKDGNIIIANKAYYHLVNCKKVSDCEKCFRLNQRRNALCPPNVFSCPLHELLHNKNNNITVIQQFASAPGRQLAINAAKLNLINIEGRKQEFVVTSIRDLSEDIRFSHQQKLSSLGFLATSVAHEMKNHLGAIRMIVEALIEKSSHEIQSGEQQKYLKMIDNQLIECINVPERLLKLARNKKDDPGLINCVETVTEIISLLDYEAKRNGISIRLTADAPDIQILGSDTDFKMVLINLMQNAFKAMPDNGKLEIEIKQNKSAKVTIKIRDNGIGISKENLKHIFEPFFTDGSSSHPQTGTGLGLAIAKSIVENSNGTIKVSSKEKCGTTFTMTFPGVKSTRKAMA